MRAATLIALLLASACSCGEAPLPEVDRPNIVLIIGDDHGYPDFGFMGSPYVETPHLDRLAAEGTLFTHGFNTASKCLPSLRTLLTGLYPHQFSARRRLLRRMGVKRGFRDQIELFVTLPRQLAGRGYASFQAGKFWDGDYAPAGFTGGMLRPGESLNDSATSIALGRRVPLDPVYEFIDAQADRPFFLWFAPMLPHVPHDASEEYRQRYVGRGLASSAVAYYANVTRFDDLVGELISHLERAELRERTLVVYLADNGWDQKPHEEIRWFTGGERGKASMHEMGIRTPIIFSWPGVVPGGEVSDALVSTVDLFPTLLDYAGAPPRTERPGRSLRPLIQQGRRWQRDRVFGMGVQWRRSREPEEPETGAQEPYSEPGEAETGAEEPSSEPQEAEAEAEFEEFASEFAEPASAGEVSASGRPGRLVPERSYFVRDRDWWYIWNATRGVHELYDAEKDPRAERNLAAEQPELVERLREQALAWDAETRLFLKPPKKRRRAGRRGANP